MSDSLTDAQRVIDRVLEDCYPVFDPDGHINGTVPGRGAWDCHCGMVVNTTEAEVRAHVTVEIDKALGGLTRERSFGIVSHSTSVNHGRFVGGWTAEDGRLQLANEEDK